VGDAGKNKKSGRKQNRTCAGAGGAQLAGSGWDSASRGEGSRSNRRFGRRDAAPPLCLSLVSPSLGLDQRVAVATEKGKRSWRLEQPPKTGRVVPSRPTRPNPRGDAGGGGGGESESERLRCATDRSRGRRAAKANGRITGGGWGLVAAGDGCSEWRRSGGNGDG